LAAESIRFLFVRPALWQYFTPAEQVRHRVTTDRAGLPGRDDGLNFLRGTRIHTNSETSQGQALNGRNSTGWRFRAVYRSRH